MICIVDYGVGNIQAFLNLFKRIGVEARRASTCEELVGAQRLVLPGVGHFDHAMKRLNDSGLRSDIRPGCRSYRHGRRSPPSFPRRRESCARD